MSKRDLYAEMRGLDIHDIRALMREHRRNPPTTRLARRHIRIAVWVCAAHLRDLGPGPVQQPECSDGRGVLGDVVTWWGPR